LNIRHELDTIAMFTLRESINVPDVGSRSFTIEVQIPEETQIVPNEIKIVVEAIKQFIESGGEVGDVLVGQDWIVEFSLLRETVIKQDETGLEYCKTYLIAVLRSASDETGTECKAAYRVVIDFDKQRIVVQDASGLVGLRQRTSADKLVVDI